MKARLLILSMWISLFGVAAVETTTKYVDVYRQEKGSFKTLRVPMVFDTDSITRRKPGVDIGLIYRVDYVATSPGKNLSAYQKSLDKKRWNTLNEFLGIEGMEYERHIYYQTKASSKEEAEKLYHGFIVYYGESVEKLHLASFSLMGDLMAKVTEMPITEETKSVRITKPRLVDSLSYTSISKTEMDRIERQYQKNNHIVEWYYDSIGRDQRYYNAYYLLSKVSGGMFMAFTSLKDKSLFNMLKRTTIEDSTLIVTDLTGSMYPYYSQLLLWHTMKMHGEKELNYVFFNDGDKKGTDQKKIGKTGGIYPVQTSNSLDLYRTMEDCMAGGGGGDLPENNFEAALSGIKEYKNVNRIVMLCDNWAVPRDTSLLAGIHIPIDFIMCGTHFGVNATYLDLARQNGGSISTIEKSIENLSFMKEGETVLIGPKEFILKKGQFKPLR